jgi:hypothetical protein
VCIYPSPCPFTCVNILHARAQTHTHAYAGEWTNLDDIEFFLKTMDDEAFGDLRGFLAAYADGLLH